MRNASSASCEPWWSISARILALGFSVVAVEAQVASLTPSALSFSKQVTGTVSTAKLVTITNSGTSPLSVTSVNLPAPFSSTDTCAAPVAPAGNCKVSVYFSPVIAGTVSAALSISTNAPGSPHQIALSGLGANPVSISPASLTFAARNIGSPSPALSATITNNQPVPLSIASITTSGDFSQTTTCAASLAAGANCRVSVVFTPTAPGARTGNVTIAHGAPGSPLVLGLSGSGLLNLTASPTSLVFAAQTAGTVSAAKTVTLTNSNPQPVSITAIAATGDYTLTHGCGAVVNPSSNCAISVKFAPAAPGTRTGTLTITSSATNSPQTISLSGSGTATLTVAPTSLSFGNQPAGTVSAAKTVKLTNSSNVSITIGSITGAGDFAAAAGTCTGAIAPGGNCTFSVTFQPAAIGARTGTASIVSTGTNSPQSVALTGSGTASLTLAPTSLSFGNVPAGTLSAGKNVTLTNPSSVPITVSDVSAPSGFQISANACLGVVAASGGTCTFTVKFQPESTGAKSGAVTVTSTGTNSPQSLNVTGTGTATMTLSPTSLNLGTEAIGYTSVAKTLKLTNANGIAVSISAIAITGTHAAEFAATNDCPTSLAASAFCTVTVTFSPAASGTRTAALTITHSGAANPQNANLSGTGAAPNLSASPLSVSFGVQTPGTQSAPQTVTLTNTGTTSISSLVISTPSGPAGIFPFTRTCGTSLAAGASCQVSVKFAPQSNGSATGNLQIISNALNSPFLVPLSGAGVSLQSISITPLLPFDFRMGQTIQLTATGLYSDNSTQDLTSQVTWAAQNPSIIAVSATGLASAVSGGVNAQFTASFSGVTGYGGGSVTQFRTGPSLQVTRSGHNLTLLTDGRVLVTGGHYSGDYSAEIRDPATGNFSVLPASMLRPRGGDSTTLLPNGTVLIAGANVPLIVPGPEPYAYSAEIFHPGTGTFVATGEMYKPLFASDFVYAHSATLLSDGRILLAGGWVGGSQVSFAQLYDYKTGTFSLTGSLPEGLAYHTATLLRNGKVLIAGGYNGNGACPCYRATAYLYDPAAGTFTATGPLNHARAYHGATLLNNGKVLLAGGLDGTSFPSPMSNTAELYDPATGLFTDTAPIPSPLVNALAVPQSNGKVMIVSNGDGSVVYLFDPATGSFTSIGSSANALPINPWVTLLNGDTLFQAGSYLGGLYTPYSPTPPGLVSISVTPSSPVLAAGTAVRLTATGTFSNASTQILEGVTWSSGNPASATVTNGIGTAGWVYGVGAGAASITATAGSITGSTVVTVQ